MEARLDGRVALVTGGSSGIGRATALCFAAEGAKVVVADVDAKGGEETAVMINDKGGDAVFTGADVSQASQVEAMVNKAVEAYGRLDCAYNNAGIDGGMGLVHEYPEDDWDVQIGVNLKGVWLCMKYEIAQMLRQGSGAIVNTSSIRGLVAGPGRSCYSACKHGVIGLTKTAAIEYAKDGIRVNAVCPGVTITPMTQPYFESGEMSAGREIEKHPIGRPGVPEEIAESVVWLCSDDASFVTGHAMSVDGGYTIH